MRKMNKKEILTIMLGILILSIVAASGLIPNFGQIKGETVVSPPTIYFDGDRNLKIDELPEVPKEFTLKENQTTVFESDNLSWVKMYDSKFYISLWARATGAENPLVYVDIIKFSENESKEICKAEVIPNDGSNFVERNGECLSNGEINFASEDKIKIIISVNTNDSYEFSIGENYTHGYSRVEVYKNGF
jgi:hypothetical protein